jgi:hypothetical protein
MVCTASYISGNRLYLLQIVDGDSCRDHLCHVRYDAQVPGSRSTTPSGTAGSAPSGYSPISGRAITGSSIRCRLTTRWSGPGHGGAIVCGSLGRAAQLEAVSLPMGCVLEDRMASLSLFDEPPHPHLDAANFAEPAFSYLNRSTRPGFRFIRAFLEQWFRKYPSPHKPELRARFRSSLDSQHNSAFFELLLHEAILRLGADVEVHPTVDTSSRSPDFQVTPADGQPFYVEATITTYQSDKDAAAEARLNELYDALNRHVDSGAFFIWVEIDQAPEEPPPARRIAHFLNSMLRDLDPDAIAMTYEREGIDAVPQWTFSQGEWSISFRPIPKKKEARGRPGVRPLGMFGGSFKSVDHRTPLRESIANKAAAYGDLQRPFLIAVNALEVIDEIDVMETLFGKEQFTVYFSTDAPTEPVQTRQSRVPDGVWTGPSGPTNTRISGVILAHRLHPWSVGQASVRLYHNPWAQRPYQSILTSLPQAVPRDGRYEYIEGKQFREILALEWPSELAG